MIIYYHYDYFETLSYLPELIHPAFCQLRQPFSTTKSQCSVVVVGL